MTGHKHHSEQHGSETACSQQETDGDKTIFNPWKMIPITKEITKKTATLLL